VSHLTWQDWGWILFAMLCLYYHLRVVFSLKLDRAGWERVALHNDREANRFANERDYLRKRCGELEEKLMGGAK
jgi:hypothetical protein